ncbi:MAG TPA: 50S ribosomal protein L6 [Candidatus Cloacimonetes bacterium]|nr:50S ribosomal protein L6 [Candidatus Cloacimonadota bacterium]
MSRIGKTPVKLPDGVKVSIAGQNIDVSGKNGELKYIMKPGISVVQEENLLKISREDDSREQKCLHGLTRALINNMVIGVSEGYKKVLQVIGTGYSAEIVGIWLKLSIGFSHDILLEIPENIKVEAEAVPRAQKSKLGIQSIVRISGIHKEDVGKFAAEIRHCRPPENFKGKGIRYEGEYVKIKPGKTSA